MSAVVDLRSDMATRPTPAMRDAMYGAELGDDVCGDDPSVNALQRQIADHEPLRRAIAALRGFFGES